MNHVFVLLDINKHWARRRKLETTYSGRVQVLFSDCAFMKKGGNMYSGQSDGNPAEKNSRAFKYILLACLHGHFDLALEAGGSPNSPFDEKTKSKVRVAIEEFTKFGLVLRASSKLRAIEKLGWVLSHLSSRLQGYNRVFGWGSDADTVEKRYRYLNPSSPMNLFRK